MSFETRARGRANRDDLREVSSDSAGLNRMAPPTARSHQTGSWQSERLKGIADKSQMTSMTSGLLHRSKLMDDADANRAYAHGRDAISDTRYEDNTTYNRGRTTANDAFNQDIATKRLALDATRVGAKAAAKASNGVTAGMLGKFSPVSIEAFKKTGDYSLLKPVQTKEKFPSKEVEIHGKSLDYYGGKIKALQAERDKEANGWGPDILGIGVDKKRVAELDKQIEHLNGVASGIEQRMTGMILGTQQQTTTGQPQGAATPQPGQPATPQPGQPATPQPGQPQQPTVQPGQPIQPQSALNLPNSPAMRHALPELASGSQRKRGSDVRERGDLAAFEGMEGRVGNKNYVPGMYFQDPSSGRKQFVGIKELKKHFGDDFALPIEGSATSSFNRTPNDEFIKNFPDDESKVQDYINDSSANQTINFRPNMMALPDLGSKDIKKQEQAFIDYRNQNKTPSAQNPTGGAQNPKAGAQTATGGNANKLSPGVDPHDMDAVVTDRWKKRREQSPGNLDKRFSKNSTDPTKQKNTISEMEHAINVNDRQFITRQVLPGKLVLDEYAAEATKVGVAANAGNKTHSIKAAKDKIATDWAKANGYIGNSGDLTQRIFNDKKMTYKDAYKTWLQQQRTRSSRDKEIEFQQLLMNSDYPSAREAQYWLHSKANEWIGDKEKIMSAFVESGSEEMIKRREQKKGNK